MPWKFLKNRPSHIMSLGLSKFVLKQAKKQECTLELLYLIDDKKLFTSLDDLKGYDGGLTSCVDIVGGMTGTMVRRGRKLIRNYLVPPELAHKCIAIYMGKVGDIDYEYVKYFPESTELITQVGTIVREFYTNVSDIKKLYKLVKNAGSIPEYHTSVVTLVHELSDTADIRSIFSSRSEPFDIIMEVTKSGVRRKISTDVLPRDITRKYITPYINTYNYLMIRWKRKDYMLYDNVLTYIRKERGANISELLGVLGDLSVVSTEKLNTYVMFTYEYNWHRRVMAYIATSYKPFRSVVTLNKEMDYSLPYISRERELLTIHIDLISTKCTFKNKYVTVFGHGDTLLTVCTIAIVKQLLDVYNREYKKVYKFLSSRSWNFVDNPIRVPSKSKIDDLRTKLPELFVRNYTRECHRLPVMIDKEKQAGNKLAIKYPKTGKYSRWYTSPSEDLYVGLKVNRLSNKSTFKYIVVCYTSNHLINPSKKTYQYYNNDDQSYVGKYKKDIKTLKALAYGRQGPLPSTMEAEYGVYNYKRLGTGNTIVSCLEHALGQTVDLTSVSSDVLNVLSQELCNIPEVLIREQLKSGEFDGTTYYRLLEELFKCNILIVQVDNQGKYKLSIPEYKSYYVWNTQKYKKYVVVLKNIRKLYHDVSITYELIVSKKGTQVFPIYDDLVSKLVTTKRACTVPAVGTRRKKDIKLQYIDENGKCVLLFLKDGTVVECNTQPYPLPVIDRDDVLRKCSRLYQHMQEVNKIRTDKHVWLSTTSDYLYFPNDESFLDWMDY